VTGPSDLPPVTAVAPFVSELSPSDRLLEEVLHGIPVQPDAAQADEDAGADLDELAAELRELFSEDTRQAAAAKPPAGSVVRMQRQSLALRMPRGSAAAPMSDAVPMTDNDWEVEMRRLMGEEEPTGAVVSGTAAPAAPSAPALPPSAPAFDEDEEDLLNDLMASRDAVMLQPLVAELRLSPQRAAAELRVPAAASCCGLLASERLALLPLPRPVPAAPHGTRRSLGRCGLDCSLPSGTACAALHPAARPRHHHLHPCRRTAIHTTPA